MFLKYILCNVFTQKTSDWNKHLSDNVFQRVRIKSHLSSLTNVENSTSNFHQFIQIYCKEEREENNGNCKAFWVTGRINNNVN